MNRTLIAIDPGASGGIAVRHGDEPIIAHKMPKTEGDLVELLQQIRVTSAFKAGSLVAVIEDQCGFSMPGRKVGAQSMFTFGRGFGFLLGALQSTFWRIHLVRPQKWQAELSLGSKKDAGGKTAWKNKLKARAQQLYPHLTVNLGTADALLLLEYAVKKELK